MMVGALLGFLLVLAAVAIIDRKPPGPDGSPGWDVPCYDNGF